MAVEKRDEQRAKARRTLLCERARACRAPLVFYGDSHTEFWEEAGQEAWQKYLAAWGAEAFGVYGDMTQDLLARLHAGELDLAEPPRVIVLLIGANNTVAHFGKEPVEQTFLEIKQIIELLHERFPSAVIVLEGLFPRGRTAQNPIRRKREALNQKLASLDLAYVRYKEHGALLLDSEGKIKRELTSDGLHLNAQGYECWGRLLEEMLSGELADCF